MTKTRMRTPTVLFAILSAGCLTDMEIGGYSGYRWSDDSTGDPSSDSTPTPSATFEPRASSASPDFGPTVRLDDPPPPISGGTLTVTSDGRTAVAADPDRDAVYLVDLVANTVRTIALASHDEPARIALDSAGRAHVALRSGGAIATIDIATASLRRKRQVCPLPRGVAYDGSKDALLVACAGGELVTLPAAEGEPLTRVDVRPDLRDVVVGKNGVMATTFRHGELISLDATHQIRAVAAPRVGVAVSRVAWRMVAPPDGQSDPVVVSQLAPEKPVPTPPVYYDSLGGSMTCAPNGPSTVMRHGADTTILPDVVLPVDIAVAGGTAAVVSAGNGHTPSLATLFIVPFPGPKCILGTRVYLAAQITSVAFKDKKTLLAQSREPALLFVLDATAGAVKRTIELAKSSREDTGHAIFHSNSGAAIACASCHPEGRDDGHVWRSESEGALRTPSLLGTLRGTAPYHWRGEQADMHALAKTTFVTRMRGPELESDRVDALDGWLTALPALKATVRDAAAATRGEAVFNGAGRCTTCHAGSQKTNNASVNVGLGGAFQVPSLVNVGFRAPYFHDGSRSSLTTILDSAHAGTSLSPAQMQDLASFLETL